MSEPSAGMRYGHGQASSRLPPRPLAGASGRGAHAGRRAAGRGRPRRGPTAGAGRPGHRQDHHDRGDRRRPVTNRAIDPERVLVLTFSRKAAEELRERITARLHRTTRQPLALTFHSYAYALVRREFVLAGDEPPTLLSGPEQLLEVRRMLRGEAEDGGPGWPERLRPALGTRGFAAELRDFLLRAAE